MYITNIIPDIITDILPDIITDIIPDIITYIFTYIHIHTSIYVNNLFKNTFIWYNGSIIILYYFFPVNTVHSCTFSIKNGL